MSYLDPDFLVVLPQTGEAFGPFTDMLDACQFADEALRGSTVKWVLMPLWEPTRLIVHPEAPIAGTA
jgi:hypothetical protein